MMVRHSIISATAFVAACLGACSADNQSDSAGAGVVQSADTVSTKGVTASLALSSDWGSGYCTNITLTNGNTTAITSWSLTVNLNNTTVASVWSANYSVSSGKLTLTPQAFNKSIAARASVSVGFCGNGSGTRPTIASLAVEGGASAGTGGASSTGGARATGGAVTTGGSTSVGGSAALTCGLPAAGSTGVPKPSGTAGNLKVLNWAGFKAAVSYTFDDANSSQLQHYAKLQALGVPMTFYLITSKAEASNAVWAQAVKDGHELGNHTKSHMSSASLADAQAAETFIQSKFGVRAYTMAAPNGDSSWQTVAPQLFMINRGVSNTPILPNDNTSPFNVPTYIPPASAPASAFNSQIDAARSAGRWQTILVHGFTGGSDSAYQPVSINDFVAGVNHAKSFGDLWFGTMTQVGAYWIGQKLVSRLTPTTSGTSKVWSWSLPANFAPGKCLRVTVDGGTLKQNGVALAWNTRGYYEISLDAGSVTLSP
jgi:peptidoglycan/xylan/chitin deacetylase (PgdA/CDA1 family)